MNKPTIQPVRAMSEELYMFQAGLSYYRISHLTGQSYMTVYGKIQRGIRELERELRDENDL